MFEVERVRDLNGRPEGGGDCVLYWMRTALRAGDNPSLNLAREAAARLAVPVVVCFCLQADYPNANARSFSFLLECLSEAFGELEAEGVACFVFRGKGIDVFPRWKKPALLVLDRAFPPSQREDALAVAAALDCACLEVDADSCVPMDLASVKQEWSAATLRRKLMPLLPRYGLPAARPRARFPRWDGDLPARLSSLLLDIGPFGGHDPEGRVAFFEANGIDATVEPVSGLSGGTKEARKRLRSFVEGGLEGYAQERRDSDGRSGSGLSPYLHFGAISVRMVVEAAMARPGQDADAFVEQAAVRRDLARNFAWHCRAPTAWEGLPSWAQKTLSAHRRDKRDYLYERAAWEAGATHDRAWNAAQAQLRKSGTMDGRMRMYWGKKLLEWSASPEEAIATAVALNDRWALDGRDPNGWAGVLWCFGLHDRPWTERRVFGMIRYMNETGLRRKMDLAAYQERWLGPLG